MKARDEYGKELAQGYNNVVGAHARSLDPKQAQMANHMGDVWLLMDIGASLRMMVDMFQAGQDDDLYTADHGPPCAYCNESMVGTPTADGDEHTMFVCANQFCKGPDA